MAPVASVWRRAWTRPRGGGPRDSDGGGGLLPLTAGGDSSSTSDTTYTTGTSSAASAGEWRPRGDLHPFTEEDKAKKLEHIKRLVDELHADDDASERWLSEMDVGWVLRLAALGTHEFLASVVTSHGLRLLVETWILALRKIGESILTSLDEGASKQPPASEFAELVQATVLKMLPFVDVVAAAKTGERRPDASAEKLQEFHTICPFDLPSLFLTRKIDGYVDSYLHESWAPALKCLQDPATPRCCFARHSSPVPFVSKFQKTYAAQKAWKVPDPQMRRRLRKAVVDRVIPVFQWRTYRVCRVCTGIPCKTSAT